MDKSNQAIEEELQGKELLSILNNQNLDIYRKQVHSLVKELKVDVLDYAAALVYLIQQDGSINTNLLHVGSIIPRKKLPLEKRAAIKTVRYRLEVGLKHQVSVEEIKKVLIEESGVEKSRIGQIDLQANYCTVSLPSGMPTEIFLHLKKVCINQRELKISKLGGKNGNFRKKSRQRNRRRNFHKINQDSLKQEK